MTPPQSPIMMKIVCNETKSPFKQNLEIKDKLEFKEKQLPTKLELIKQVSNGGDSRCKEEGIWTCSKPLYVRNGEHRYDHSQILIHANVPCLNSSYHLNFVALPLAKPHTKK